MATNISKVAINASSNKVWNALTNPEIVKKWQYGSILLTDWEIGSEIRFKTEWEGKIFEQWGKVIEVIPNEKLRYTLFAPRPDLEDKPENYFVIEYRLTEKGTTTLLEIIQEDNRPGAKQEAVKGEENPIMKGLQEIIEAEA